MRTLKYLSLAILSVSVICLHNDCNAARAVTVVADTANKSHWTQELAKFAEQLQKLQTQIENQADMINKKALDLMSHDSKELESAGKEFTSMMQSINTIHDSINAISNDYSKTLQQWDDLMPDYKEWQDMSVLNMARQTAKTRDEWEKALKQGLLVTGNHGLKERAETQNAVNKALRLSETAKGSVQSMQALAQLNALNGAALQRLENQIAEGNRMRAISEMRKLDEEKKLEQFINNESLMSKSEAESLLGLEDKYKASSGRVLSRK